MNANYEVVVVGSLVVDLPVWLGRAPERGETLMATQGGIFPGGKGFNQAVQIARLSGHPLLLGSVGEDVLGEMMRAMVRAEVGDDRGIATTAAAITSYAVPVITPDGQYILHVSGANRTVQPVTIRTQRNLWGGARILMVQGEISPAATAEAMDEMLAREGTIILDPAPATDMTDDLLARATVVTPNRVEFGQIAGAHTDEEVPLVEGARALFSRFPRLQWVIVTLGAQGAFAAHRSGGYERVAADRVTAVDPTAAGDAFNGALAWALTQGYGWSEALQLGVHVGSLAASREGALPSLPRVSDIDWSRLTHPAKANHDGPTVDTPRG